MVVNVVGEVLELEEPRGNGSGMCGLKWLVASSEAGSVVNQRGPMYDGRTGAIVPAAERTLPPPSEPDFETAAAVAAAHGCELLG